MSMNAEMARMHNMGFKMFFVFVSSFLVLCKLFSCLYMDVYSPLLDSYYRASSGNLFIAESSKAGI